MFALAVGQLVSTNLFVCLRETLEFYDNAAAKSQRYFLLLFFSF